MASDSKTYFELKKLPFSEDALEPNISKETISFHYGKHHAGYVKKLNAALKDATDDQKKSLEELIKTGSTPKIKNCAGQIYNHEWYWQCMRAPKGAKIPEDSFLFKQITKDFGSFDKFKTQFTGVAAGHFGSGWAWLVFNTQSKKLEIIGEHDAGCPVESETQLTPILTCDVWEHAYYVDYRNNRGEYIAKWWECVNWEEVCKSFV